MLNLEFETQFKKHGFVSQRKYPNEALLQFIGARFFSLPKEERAKSRVLELGCGSGANLWMIAKEGFSAYGIDIAPTGIEYCRQMLQEHGVSADLRVGDMLKLPYDAAFFDIIFDVVSMQHTDLAGHRLAYAEAFRCLRNGGTFFQWHMGAESVSFLRGGGNNIDEITIDDIANPDVPLSGCGMVSFLTAERASQLLSEAGFKNIQIERVTRTHRNRTQLNEFFSITASK